MKIERINGRPGDRKKGYTALGAITNGRERKEGLNDLHRYDGVRCR